MVMLLSLRVMRNARPCLLVADYLTAFAGYCFKCIIVCRSFVLLLLLLSLEVYNVLIAYCTATRVGGMHDICAIAFQEIFCSACVINFVVASYFYET